MRRLRGIHLFFVLFFVAIILFFWFGFQFGKETQRQTDLVQITEAELMANNTAEDNSQNELITVEIEDTVETTADYEQPRFYLKQVGEYVTVYVSATDEVYFETDIIVEELPIELQEELQYQIDFYDLESVYTFLENYSS